MTDFSMNEILRSFRKMRMQRCSGQGSHLVTQHNHHHHHHQHLHHHHHHHHHQTQQQQQQQPPTSTGQQSKDLKKIIKILKKNVIKAKITRKMKIVV
ncbi:PREDICTED: protein disconnected [Drosophila arizonae]|uniref:Protein disconnected n=1 Tax=Drosophila arizonae TaxID=7263 RepID=A0ABM1NQP8_DROAR|nr:PREDICTED: protein disconnected [Drosophila arizonae]